MKQILIQILLPVAGSRANAAAHKTTTAELTDAFGGLTRYSRAPADGLWKKAASTTRDAIVVYEVMARRLDRPWWRRYQRRLEERFRQEEVVIRSQPIDAI